MDFLIGLVVLIGGLWLASRGPVPVLRVIVALLVVVAAFTACGALKIDTGVDPAS